ncbi:hypothetical protein HZB02_00735 [Candidatus Woesearchaeota archaeon]|nr:hypothetical protein [Candidatus Woesearchaeota archaeon]
MGLEEVKQEIQKKAEADVHRLLAEAKQEGNSILQQARERAATLQKEADLRVKEMVNRMERTEVSAAQAASRRKLLEAKKEVLDSVFTQLKKNLGSLSVDKKKKLCKRLLEKAEQQTTIKKMYCNQNDKALFTGYPVTVQPMLGGCKAESDDGMITIDYSFDMFLEQVKEEQLQYAGKMLFGGY